MKILFVYPLSLIMLLVALAGRENPEPIPDPESSVKESIWVDSVFNALSVNERIAQLIMVAAYSNKSLDENSQLTTYIKDYNIGGVIFFQGGPVAQAKMTNYWQGIAKTPLFIAIDGEWGLGMRLKDSTLSFPRQMTLGAIQDTLLLEEMGREIGRQCKRIGIHINFAPVADINSNPANPVIGNRSFGEDKRVVARHAAAYMKGLMQSGVIPTAKHFPGHGDTDKDSHKTLPSIMHPRHYIDSVDLYPFVYMIAHGLPAVMVAHLNIPALDTARNTPSTLSWNIITALLRKTIGFENLIVTDALGMKGVTESYKPGDIELRAFKAGNDILLMPENVPAAMKALTDALKTGSITEEQINEKCKRVLRWKYRAGLSAPQKVDMKGIYDDLNLPYATNLNRRLYEASMTLLGNESGLLPFLRTDTLKIASLSIGYGKISPFQKMTGQYAAVDHFYLNKNFSEFEKNKMLEKLKAYNTVVVSLHATSSKPSENYGITPAHFDMAASVSKQANVAVCLFGIPYALSAAENPKAFSAILIAYQDNTMAQEVAAQAMFGGVDISGRLPVSVKPHFTAGAGITLKKKRLKYAEPEESGIDSRYFISIDSLAQSGITEKIYPGCQILVACKGAVIYHKSFGCHTFDCRREVENSDIYDLASLTKIAATTISIMKLYEEGKIDIDEKLSKYLPALDSSNKQNIIIRNLLAHQAGFKSWIPFYRRTITNNLPDTAFYRVSKSEQFPYRVAENLYLRKDYPDTILSIIISSELRKNNNYTYSDLGFYLLKKVIEDITNYTIDKYVAENFYKPLGLSTMCYQPRKYFELDRLIPSEIDTEFRKQELQGDVNDQGAAMFDGIGGHAGLFSNSNDLAILLQMLLQEGEYAGRRYFKKETVREFTSYQFRNNRRGLGFDKPVRDRNGGPTCREASDESYGHSGFTGTFVWVDPKYDLIYIFLSNRTHPESSSNKLLESGIRSSLQQKIYEAIDKSMKKTP